MQLSNASNKASRFLVVNCLSIYNIILGRPTLNCLKAATSTYCLKVKFQTPNGIREISGGQPLDIEEELETTVEESKPMEETFNVELVEGDLSKVRKIGGEL